MNKFLRAFMAILIVVVFVFWVVDYFNPGYSWQYEGKYYLIAELFFCLILGGSWWYDRRQAKQEDL